MSIAGHFIFMKVQRNYQRINSKMNNLYIYRYNKHKARMAD